MFNNTWLYECFSVTARDITTTLFFFFFAVLRVESSGASIKGMSLEEFLEKFVEDEENEKVATDFYPLSSDIVMF